MTPRGATLPGRAASDMAQEIHSILNAHLIPKSPHADLFDARGRAWLAAQQLPDDERAAIDRGVRELTWPCSTARSRGDAMDDLAVNRLMTITGVNLAIGGGIVAGIGDIT